MPFLSFSSPRRTECLTVPLYDCTFCDSDFIFPTPKDPLPPISSIIPDTILTSLFKGCEGLFSLVLKKNFSPQSSPFPVTYFSHSTDKCYKLSVPKPLFSNYYSLFTLYNLRSSTNPLFFSLKKLESQQLPT